MGAKGTTEIDFGLFPGDTHATVVVTGQSGIVAGSRLEAWLEPGDTVDHSSDEHIVESPNLRIIAADVVPGTGFTIHGVYQAPQDEPLEFGGVAGFRSVAGAVYGYAAPSVGGRVHRVHGRWKVGWVWA